MASTTAVIVTVVLISCAIGLLLGLIPDEGYAGGFTRNECLRRRVKNGFSVDGEDYEVARRIVRGVELLGRTGW